MRYYVYDTHKSFTINIFIFSLVSTCVWSSKLSDLLFTSSLSWRRRAQRHTVSHRMRNKYCLLRRLRGKSSETAMPQLPWRGSALGNGAGLAGPQVAEVPRKGPQTRSHPWEKRRHRCVISFCFSFAAEVLRTVFICGGAWWRKRLLSYF